MRKLIKYIRGPMSDDDWQAFVVDAILGAIGLVVLFAFMALYSQSN